MDFEPRYAIVTGSDSGIGRAAAVALAEQGLDVGITWHSDSAGAEETAEEVRSHGRRAVVAQLDTTELPGCGDVIDHLADELGGLDVFVNNAGAGGRLVARGHLVRGLARGGGDQSRRRLRLPAARRAADDRRRIAAVG